MRVAIFGAGAVGSPIAARLALAGNDVVVFARGAHADVMATAASSCAMLKVSALRKCGSHTVDPTDLRDIAKAGAQQRPGELRG
jgi:ketopantoate reductase